MATFAGSITVNDVAMTALTDIAASRRVSVTDLANAALTEYARGTCEEFEQRLDFVKAYARATEAEKMALIAQVKTIRARG